MDNNLIGRVTAAFASCPDRPELVTELNRHGTLLTVLESGQMLVIESDQITPDLSNAQIRDLAKVLNAEVADGIQGDSV